MRLMGVTKKNVNIKMIKKIDSVSDMNSNANNTAGTSVSG